MVLITTPQSMHNALMIQLSGNPAIAELYKRQFAEQANKSAVAEQQVKPAELHPTNNAPARD